MYRALLPFRSRYMEYKYFTFAYMAYLHILLLEQAYIDSVFVVYSAPKRLLQLVDIRIREVVGFEHIVVFFYPKNNYPALSVCKGRIGFPKRFRETAECRLEFY